MVFILYESPSFYPLVIEHINQGASMYGTTIQDHPICLLVKKVVRKLTFLAQLSVFS